MYPPRFRQQQYDDMEQEDSMPMGQAQGPNMGYGSISQVPQSQPEEQQQQATRPWDRTAFRDEWMSSGVNTVPGMQDWLQKTGWGSQVRTAGSKGDVMQLPSGENIDAILAAGLGGGRGGPQWTGKGSWNNQYDGGGYASPSPQQYGNMFGGSSFYGGGMQQQQPQQNRMYNQPQQMQRRMNPTTGQRFQSRGFGASRPSNMMGQPTSSRRFQSQQQPSFGGGY